MSPPRPNHQNLDRVQSAGSPNTKHLFPKNLSISHMIKLGKLAKPNESVTLLEVYSFDVENIAWSVLPQKVEFVIDNDVLGNGGFRQALEAKSSSTNSNTSLWVVEEYLPKAIKEITEDIKITVEEHTKKVVQMHARAKNIAEQLDKKVQELNVSKKFGEALKYKDICLVKLDSDCFTLGDFIEGNFQIIHEQYW